MSKRECEKGDENQRECEGDSKTEKDGVLQWPNQVAFLFVITSTTVHAVDSATGFSAPCLWHVLVIMRKEGGVHRDCRVCSCGSRSCTIPLLTCEKTPPSPSSWVPAGVLVKAAAGQTSCMAEMHFCCFFSAGQGSITVPGCLAATPIEAPITIEEGYPTQASKDRVQGSADMLESTAAWHVC